MEEKKVLCTDKKQLPELIRAIVVEKLEGKVLDIKFLGGGSFGFAYKVDIDKEPGTLVVKTFKIEGMHKKRPINLVFWAHIQRSNSQKCTLHTIIRQISPLIVWQWSM